MKNAFTIDFEDWYQGITIPIDKWNQYEKRIHVGHEKLLKLLQKNNTKATYFLLGKVIEEHPKIIQEIIDEGHEIGCHTYQHKELYNLSPESFKEEILSCQQLIRENYGIEYKGFRAPYFSLDERSWWALDILKDTGFEYDSSIYPGDNKRTGIKGFRKDIHLLENGLPEVPLSNFKLLKFDVGLGGAYFRILPFLYFKQKFMAASKKAPVIFYIHPWELDPEHPFLPELSRRIRYPHYFNLKRTESKIDRLLQQFEFAPLSEIVTETNLV